MAYADLIDREGIAQNYFGVLNPRKKMEGFTVFSGSVYSASFPYGYPVSVDEDGSALTEGASTALTAGQWFYSGGVLYVRSTDNADPDTHFVVVTFSVYIGTLGRHWYRDPVNDTTGFVYYEPLIVSSPSLRSKVSGALLGYLPVESSSITLSDPSTAKTFQRLIYDCSFNDASIKLYHWLSIDESAPIDIDSIKLVYNGLMSNVSYKLNEVSIQLFDRTDIFSAQWRNTDESFYSVATFANLDPNSIALPIRYVYGVVDGFKPINIDYDETGSTSTNRTWCCIGEQVNLANVTASVIAGSTTTTTKLSGVSKGLRVGDRVFFNRAAGTDDYGEVLAVAEAGGNTTITHKDLTGSGGAMTAGDSVERSFVGAIDVVQSGVIYKLQYNRDYTTEPALSGGTAGFTLTNNFEANHSGMTTFLATDQIACRIYGRKNDVAITGPISVGSNDTESNNLTSPVVILLDLLLNRLSIAEGDIDTASFIDEEPNVTDALGFAIPEDASSSFPTFKDIILNISKSSLLRLFINNDLMWTVGRITNAGAYSKIIRDDEVLDDSFEYEFDYKDLASDVTVQYARREIPASPIALDTSYSKVTVNSPVASYLHKVQNELSVNSLHFKSADATTLAQRMAYIFGERQGKLTIKVKNRFFDSLINDTHRLSSARLPVDAAFDLDVDQAGDFVIESISKNTRSVTITFDDQKGIADNSGSF